MKPWVDLYKQHLDLRAADIELVTEVRRALRTLGEMEPSVFDPSIQQRLQQRNNTENGIRLFSFAAPEYIAAWNLSPSDQANIHLEEAHLTVLLRLGAAELHEMVMMVEGRRKDGSPWTIAIHLPDNRETAGNPKGDRQGHGAGGHAALHCHVGPSLDVEPKFRVPLPPLRPGVLLRWLMSQVVPTLSFEPAPWLDVTAELDRRRHTGG